MVALEIGSPRLTETLALRLVIRDLLDRGALLPGAQSRLAKRWGVSRRHVSRLVAEERNLIGEARWRPLGSVPRDRRPD
jgi:hypothetical protein